MDEEHLDIDEAIHIVAQQVLANAIEDIVDDWDKYPEIGEDDWEKVVEELFEMAGPGPKRELYFEAYGLLEERAAQFARVNDPLV